MDAGIVTGAAGALGHAVVDVEHLEGIWRSHSGSARWTTQAAAPRFAVRGGGAVVLAGSKTAVGGPAPATRAVPPAAIAMVIAFLCGPGATPISGAVVPVYGDA